ncbi:MAG: hypothetical protein WCK84_08620 [Bacteroidota bacterium]
MDDQEHQNQPAPKKRRPRPWLIVLLIFLLFLVISFIGLFLGLNYFGERFLRKYLQDKILTSSDGLYHADFKKLNVNILTGKVLIDSFELTPDTLRYRQLKTKGRVSSALYQISFSSLTIDRVHFGQIYAGKQINFRQLTVQRPLLSIVSFPDTLAAKRTKWRVIYEDLYPAISGLFKDFHIDSVKVSHGVFLSSFTQKTGMQTSGEYEFSSTLRDVSVNPFSYYNHERVFYSRDVEFVVHNFEYALADSLYFLKAENIGFSLTKSILFGNGVTLRPNFRSARIRTAMKGDFYQLDVPAFKIQGVDLYKAMTSKKVDIKSVSLSDFSFKVFRNIKPADQSFHKKQKKKISFDDLYAIIANELHYVAIDSLSVKNASFDFFGSIRDPNPELRIGQVDLALDKFRLDSLSHKDKSRIFYSLELELSLKNFSLMLRDGIHRINAATIYFSSRKSLIDVDQSIISPDSVKNLSQNYNRRNTIYCLLPRLIFTGINLKTVFNRRILDFDRLVVQEPEIKYKRFRLPKNPDPRFKRPGDFFEEENEDVVYNLLKKYLWEIRGKEIGINKGSAQFSIEREGAQVPIASAEFNLVMQDFLIDSVHGMNRQGYFYSRDFDLDLKSVSIFSPDSLKHLQAGSVHIVTKDSLIEAVNVRIFNSAKPLQFNSPLNKWQSLTFEFSLKKLYLTGLNHKKLFLEKTLKANQIVFDNPFLSLKTTDNQQSERTPEETQLIKTNKFVHFFEIGRCLVRKGAFSYDGEEDRKASYFFLKDIDFAVVNASVHIPERGLQNGLIKFDSIQLKVVPLRAVIADSSYALEARSLEVHSYPSNIIIQGMKITPLKSRNIITERKIQATITIPEIRFNGFYFDRAIFDNQWLLEDLYVERPLVYLEMQQDNTKVNRLRPVDPSNLVRIPTFMKIVAVNKVSVADAEVGLMIKQHDSLHSYSLKNILLQISRFRVDSATRSNPGQVPLFNANDIWLSAPGFSWASSDSMYTFAIRRVGFSTGSASAFLDSVTVTPNFNKLDFSRKSGYQTDRIVLRVPGIEIKQIDFRKLISDRELHAYRVNMRGLNFESYRDKRLPFPSWQRPLMPGQMIAGIKFPAVIDTIALSNGFASYEEQTGNEPGRVFFDNINAFLTGFTTLKAGPETPNRNLDLYGTSRLMGMAPMESWIQFQTDHPRDTFNVRALIGEFDLTNINPMLSKLLPASIKRGTSSKTEIVQINANNARAVGMLSFRYNNLAIILHPTQPGTWRIIEQSLLTELANLLLSNSNPNDDGKMKWGFIYFDRDQSRGFFNYLWKSTLSGIKSSMGINSKEQKKMIKEEKRRAKNKDKKSKK